MKHAKDLSLTLREGDKLEATAMGLDPAKGVFFAYRNGVWRRTALVDGNVAAMWGLGGTIVGQVGQPYLITGVECEKVSPFAFARVYKQEVELMKTMFPTLENYVDSRYKGAVRMLKIAGFQLSEEPVQVKPTGALFYKFRMAQ